MTERTEPVGEMFKQAAQLRTEVARIAARQVSDQASQEAKVAEAGRLESIENEKLREESSELAKAFIKLMETNNVPKTAYAGRTYGYDWIKGHGWILRQYTRGTSIDEQYINPVMGFVLLDDGSLHPWASVGDVMVNGQSSRGLIMTEDEYRLACSIHNPSDPPNYAYLATSQGKALLSAYISKSGVPIPGEEDSSVSMNGTNMTNSTLE